MKLKVAFIALANIVSTSAMAVSVDLRHEYTDGRQENKDRLLVSHRFANGFGFSLEGKSGSGGAHRDRPFSDMEGNSTEYTASYGYNVDKNLNIQPGMALETGDSKATYKPYFRAQYSFDNGIYIAGRYRYEYTRNTGDGAEDEHVNRGDVWLGYKLNAWRLEYNYLYRESDKIRFDNKKWDYEHDIKVAYAIDRHWAPYVEVGNVSVAKNQDARQTRYRVGVAYVF